LLDRVLRINDSQSLRKRENAENGSHESRDLIDSSPEKAKIERRNTMTHLPLQDFNAKPDTHALAMKTYEREKGLDSVVDSVAKGLFPFVFLVFNIFYWSFYLKLF
jgi:hypothetical protein